MVKLAIVELAFGPMMNRSYLVADDDAHVCAVVDPSWDAKGFVDAAQEHGWAIEAILLTHTHFDHINAIEELARLTNAPISVHRTETSELPKNIEAQPTDEGTTIAVGGLHITCLHTPGHSPGSQCFLVEDHLFTGDTLFVEGCGRVDLPGGSEAQMRTSLARLAALPPETIVHPGHHYGSEATSTIGAEKERNPYL